MINFTCQHCGKTSETKYEGKIYCNSACGSAAWRKRNPRKKSMNSQKDNEAYQICGKDNQRRDKPDKWIAYMRLNPEYFAALGKINIKSLVI